MRPAHPRVVNFETLVLFDGVRTGAIGRVVSIDGVVTFEPPLPVSAVVYAPGREPPLRRSSLGVRVTGVDLEGLTQRREKDGAVEGWAELAGTWRDETLYVDAQLPGVVPVERHADWSTPPCAPPAGGWPHGSERENLNASNVLDDAAVVTLVSFRPSDTQVVLVVAATEPDRVERELRPRFGERLCVVPSAWTKSHVDDALSALQQNMDAWLLWQCGLAVGDDAQALVCASAARVTPEFAAWANSMPAGLLRVNAWLAPAGVEV